MIRNPKSFRPWQHVLDPLIGYLKVLEIDCSDSHFEKYNFGPAEHPITVSEVVQIAREVFPEAKFKIPDSSSSIELHLEAKALALDSSLARKILDWEALLDQQSSIRQTFQWWDKLFSTNTSAKELCKIEIQTFLSAYQQRIHK